MPNHCENILIVSGEKAKVEEFIADHKNTETGEEMGKPYATEHELDFNADVPQPKLKGDAWHGWRCENWGNSIRVAVSPRRLNC